MKTEITVTLKLPRKTLVEILRLLKNENPELYGEIIKSLKKEWSILERDILRE